MKRNLLIFGTIFGLMILASCGSDDGPSIPPIVGEWEIEDFDVQLTVSDPDFAGVNGNYSSLYGEDSYKIEFNQDGTYERELDGLTGLGNVDDEGEWELDGDELELDQDDSNLGITLITDFEVVELTDDELVLEGEANLRFLPDAVIDVLDTITTQASFDAIVAEFAEVKGVAVTFNFEKDN